MNSDFFAFGEILWDCLPSGRHAGGAPFNVMAHLAQLGASAALISAVGSDALGDEILQVARDKLVLIDFVSRAQGGLATGTVIATLDQNSNATYEIVQPVAWDEILVSPGTLQKVAQSCAVVYGSLAARSPYNRGQLQQLLDLVGPLKFFDVNLRPPFDDLALVLDLAKCADVIKLNDDEAEKLAGWIKTGSRTSRTPLEPGPLADACAIIAQATATRRICVTRGVAGAALWEDGTLICAPAPHVEVKDTVGAGDAFMAGLVLGLTRGCETKRILENACRLGAFVASHFGATPVFPLEMIEDFKNNPPPAVAGRE